MIDLYAYNQLTIQDRANALWKSGSFITNVKGEELSYNLYTFFGYFVEVRLKDNEIVDIKPFRQGHNFDKYVDKVDLVDLING